MDKNIKKSRWTLKDLMKQVWATYKEKKFIHLINAGFAGGMTYVYTEEFLFAFGGKVVDPEMSHAVVMITIILLTFLILRGLTYAMERLSGSDELSKTIRHEAAQIAHIFLVIAIIASLLSWSLHENTTTVFHLIFISLGSSYALYHFMSSIKHMNFMAKPSLFELESED